MSILSIVKDYNTLPAVQCKRLFQTLEQELLKLPQLAIEDYKLKETYSNGYYYRQITIPAGALITGRIYKFDHTEIMLKGKIVILSAEGQKKQYEGFNVIEAKSGKRQAGLALEETIWITVNSVPSTIPLAEMLDYTSVLTYEEYEKFFIDLNRLDYKCFLNEIQLSQEQMNALVDTKDIIESDTCSNVEVKTSSIEGKGIFVLEDVKAGTAICAARVGNKRTIAGRYVNHAVYPNSYPVNLDGEFWYIAKSDITKGSEITVCYRAVTTCRLTNNDA